MNNRSNRNLRKKSNFSYVRSLLLLSTFVVVVITFYLFGITHKNVKDDNKKNTINNHPITKRNLVYDIIKQQKDVILSDSLGVYYKRRAIYGETANLSISYISGYEQYQNLHIKSMLIEHNITDLNDFEPFSPYFSTTLWDLYPPQVNCPDSERIGKVGDGGKWVCGIKHLIESKEKNKNLDKNTVRPCIIYSFGVSTDSSFEHDMIRLTDCEIHLFDPTIGKIPTQARRYELIKEETDKDYVGQYNSSSESSKIIDLSKIKSDVVHDPRMIFHKVALGNDSSKPTEDYYVPITLWDIMHSLNHSFVDIIKIDIEGTEWEVFSHLFSLLSTNGNMQKDTVAPIGQILVELHYKTVLSADKFFNSMLAMGFVSFSREINLMPCLSGGKPIASEYSFINPETFFSDKKSRYKVPPIISNIWHDDIKALIYYLTQKIRIPIIKISLQLLYENFWEQYPYYPVLIFHDDLDETDMNEIKSAVPLMNVVFKRIELLIPSNLKAVKLPERTQCSPHSSTIGYRHMIQFHASRIHDELFKSEYKDTEYILRIDDDSFLTYTVGYDLFRFMKINQKKYGFINFLFDDPLCIEGLWNHTRRWVNETVPPINMSSVFFNQLPEGLIAYNNFEISHSSIWKHSKWLEFINYIGSTGGIYTKRWGDAPIHTLGISLILNKSEVHRFIDIGYRHDPFVNQKPSGLPKPSADPFSDESVNCFFYERWICTNTTRNNTDLGENTLIRKPSWSSEDDTTNDYFYLNTQQASNVKVIPPQISKLFIKVELGDQYINSPQKGVLFSFGHKGREQQLANTISSFTSRFNSKTEYPFVIFYSKRDPLDFEMIERIVGIPISKFITFLPVKLKAMFQQSNDQSIQELESSCISSNKEVQATSRFLRFKASSVLTALGYDWHFRFADDSRLQSNISSNIFSQLANEKKLYAYFSAILHQSKCVESIWELMESLCNNFEIKGSAVRCSSLLQSWPRDVVIFSNFEISHRSIWESPICKLFQEAEKTHPQRSIWGDAAVHTLCLIASLEHDQIKRVTDIKYELNLGSTMQWSTDNNTDNSRNMISVPLHSSKYQSRTIPELDELFFPQRFGWMGGDVATSVALPNLDNLDSAPCLYIWLFGDSLIGTSSGKKRLEAQFVSNSVALMMLYTKSDMESKNLQNNVRQVNFYWGQEKGQPSAIFYSKNLEAKLSSSASSKNTNSKTHISYWPVSGIVVRNEASSLNLLVLGQHVKHLTGADHALVESTQSLAFVELSSNIFHVTNPYSPPDQWQYNCLSFPPSLKGKYRWITMFEPNGKSFINSPDDYLYMIGIYETESSSSSSSKPINEAAFDFLSVASRSYQILSRIKVKDLIAENMEQLEIAFSNDINTSNNMLEPIWGTIDSSGVPLTLFSPAVTELSIFLDTTGKTHVWVIVSLTLMEQKIRVCKSITLYGPWSCKFVETVLEPWDDLNTFITYAAKVHIGLKTKVSGDTIRNTSSIIISYIPNTLSGPSSLFNEGIMKQAYSPKFLEIDI